MTTELIVAAVAVVLALVSMLDRSRISKKLGASEKEVENEKRKVEQYEDALNILLSPDPTPDELERMSEAAARAAGSSAARLRELEQAATGGLVHLGPGCRADQDTG